MGGQQSKVLRGLSSQIPWSDGPQHDLIKMLMKDNLRLKRTVKILVKNQMVMLEWLHGESKYVRKGVDGKLYFGQMFDGQIKELDMDLIEELEEA